jgi:hypothetical protein
MKKENKEDIINWLFRVYRDDGFEANSLREWMMAYYKRISRKIKEIGERIEQGRGVKASEIKDIYEDLKFLCYISKYFSDLTHKIKTELLDENGKFEKRIWDNEKEEYITKRIKFE